MVGRPQMDCFTSLAMTREIVIARHAVPKQSITRTTMDCFRLAMLGVAMTGSVWHGQTPNVIATQSEAKGKQSMRLMKQPAVYIVANRRNGTLYTGVASDLIKRAWQHRESVIPGFASRYGGKFLVWHEFHATMIGAIAREKQIKGGSRQAKIDLIEHANPDWADLCETLF